MTVTLENIVNYAKNNPRNVTTRFNADGTLRILKYTKRTAYGGEWTDESRECRGLVLDNDDNIVAYPFSKFFNYKVEKEADEFSLDEPIVAIRKYNGFLAIVTPFKGKLIVTTAGSLESEYIPQIWDFIDKEKWLSVMDENITYMFECVSPTDFHVTEDNVGLTLIGFREKKIGSKIIHDEKSLTDLAEVLKVNAPTYFYGTLRELLSHMDTITFEGYVIYSTDGSGRMLKSKSDNFLAKRHLAYIGKNTIAEMEQKIQESDMFEEYKPIYEFYKNHEEEVRNYSHAERVLVVKDMLSQKPTMYVCVGLPYSGKSTYLNGNSFFRTLKRIGTDDYIIARSQESGKSYSDIFSDEINNATNQMMKELNNALQRGDSFIVDQTNTRKRKRKFLINLAKKNGFKVVAIVFAPYPNEYELKKRQEKRTTHSVPLDIIQSLKKSYEEVTSSEGFDHILKVNSWKK